MVIEQERDGFVVSTDPARIDVAAVHAYLTRSHWAAGISREIVARSIAGSLSFGLFAGRQQIGFARVITDQATFAYLADVYVLEAYRGRGLATWMIDCVVGHPRLQGLRRFVLVTRDAHGLYAKFGFTPIAHPERYMEKLQPDIYQRGSVEEQ
jgi:GNAT superfamily N-acetyltransferase